MHQSVMDWGSKKIQEHDLKRAKTLEVGARNVNGSLREVLRGEITGVDIQEGRGVDIIAPAKKLPFEDESFELVLCTEMLEHDSDFWESIPEMARVLKPGGRLILTCRGVGFHDDPNPKDYWRFTVDAILHLFSLAGIEPIEVIPDTDPSHEGVLALGEKPWP